MGGKIAALDQSLGFMAMPGVGFSGMLLIGLFAG
jgi:hypothetical protein